MHATTNLATLVRTYRRMNSFTVTELAANCECAKSTISDIERGKTYNISTLLAFSLAAVLDVSGDDILQAIYESSVNGSEPSEAEE